MKKNFGWLVLTLAVGLFTPACGDTAPPAQVPAEEEQAAAPAPADQAPQNVKTVTFYKHDGNFFHGEFNFWGSGNLFLGLPLNIVAVRLEAISTCADDTLRVNSLENLDWNQNEGYVNRTLITPEPLPITQEWAGYEIAGGQTVGTYLLFNDSKQCWISLRNIEVDYTE